MKKKYLCFLYVFIIMAFLFPYVFFEVDADLSTKTVEKRPFPDYHIIPQNRILYPRLGSPYLKSPNENFTVYLAYVAEDFSNENPWLISWNGKISSLFAEDSEYNLEVLEDNFHEEDAMWTLIFRIPENIPTELYNLTVYSDVCEYIEPNAIYVDERGFDRPLKLFIWSDSHVRFPTGGVPRLMQSLRVLNDVLNASNALDIDILIHCGDWIDASTNEVDFEYYYGLLTRLRHPLFITAGNSDSFTVEKNLYFWEEYFAPLYVSREVGPYLFISMFSDTGRVENEQIDWVVNDLSLHKNSIKTIILHHHFWVESEVSPNYYSRMPKILKDHNVNLMLMGHWHRDDIYIPSESPATICITTTSTAASNQYRGFRIMTMNHTKILYENYSIPWTALNVTALQRNDGNSSSIAILAQNGIDEELSLRIPIVLMNTGGSLRVENATLIKDFQKITKRIVEVNLSLLPGEERLVKVYQEPDNIPPTITVTPKVKDEIVTLDYLASDIGLGVREVSVFVSEDNSTWIELRPTLVAEYPLLRFSATMYRMYYRVVVVDVEQNKKTVYGSIEVPIFKPPEELTLSIETVKTDSLILSWTQSIDEDFNVYEIYQSNAFGNLGNLISTITTQSIVSYEVQNLSPETQYYFTIRVVDIDGLFTDSKQVNVTTSPSPAFPWLWIIGSGAFIILAIVFFLMRKKNR